MGYSGSLVGVPPSPRPSACASGRTRLSAWLFTQARPEFLLPCGRFLLHIRAETKFGNQKFNNHGKHFLSGLEKIKGAKCAFKIQINQRFVDKHDSPESFLVPFFVMVSCPCWHFMVILSPAKNPVCSSHFPCKRICGGACL